MTSRHPPLLLAPALALFAVAAAPGPAEAGADSSCEAEQVAVLPPLLDAETCWRTPGESPQLVGGTMFVLLQPESSDGEVVSEVVGFDPATGELVWTSGAIGGDAEAIRPITVDGAPAVAALVAVTTEGDAVTASESSWAYLAWPVGADSESEPAPSVTMPATFASELDWTSDYVNVDEHVLRPGATAFEPIAWGEPIEVGQYEFDEYLVGFSGTLSLTYVESLAWTEGGSEEGDSYSGWVARNADGSIAWQESYTVTPNQDENTLFYAGPRHIPVVVGAHAFTITGDVDGFAAPTVSWIDPATGQPAAAPPAPADLAGQPIRAINSFQAWLSPTGSHVFVHSTIDPVSVVVDVAAATVAPVASDFAITATAIDDATAYGRTSEGSATIDLATATAAALPEGSEAPIAVDPEFGVVRDPGTSELLVAHRA